MAYKFSLADAKADLGLKAISNVCSSSAQFVQYINEAQRRLLRRGEWFDTEQVVRFCVSGCIIAWPRWVGTVVGVRFGECPYVQTSQLFNLNWSFMGPHYNFRGFGDFASNAIIEDADSLPVQNQISGTTGKLLRYYTVKNSDIGKTITIRGTKYGGQPLQELDANNKWQNGLTLVAAAPYATNATYVTRIDAITREATDGMTYLYEYDPGSNTLRDLGSYEPNDTNPRMRRSKIVSKPITAQKPDANGICWTSIEALIKLEFIPVANDRDFLLIDNFDALKFMIQAIKCEEANDEQGALIKVTKAIQEMNFDLRSKNPDYQTPIRVDAIMSIGRLRNPI